MATALASWDAKKEERTTLPGLIASVTAMARHALGRRAALVSPMPLEPAPRPPVADPYPVARQRVVHGLGGALAIIAARVARD